MTNFNFGWEPFDKLAAKLDTDWLGEMEKLWQPVTTSGAKYPPFNIVKQNETNLRIELAVAGFKKEDLKIVVEQQKLTISSVDEKDDAEEPVYVYKGIAARKFTTSFALSRNATVVAADLQDGILKIFISLSEPEKKAWVLEIGEKAKEPQKPEFLQEAQ